MISEVEVTNYQSLGKMKLKLGRFTVITGRTGAGKSALIRACKALVFNVRGTKDISRGESSFSISMTGNEDDNDAGKLWQATIRRGTKDNYQLAVGVNQKTYTKLAGKVPDAVTDTLRLNDLNFATQFDRPYLLDATGGDVSRVLGKLTNVTVLFKAAQEANRLRLAVAAELKLREKDLAGLQEQIGQYATLGQEQLAVVRAESSLAELQELAQKRSRLGQLIVDYETYWRRLYGLKVVPEPPSLDELEVVVDQRQRLRQLTGRLDDANLRLRMDQREELACIYTEQTLQQELDDYVSQWGVCPNCGQPVQKTHDH